MLSCRLPEIILYSVLEISGQDWGGMVVYYLTWDSWSTNLIVGTRSD